MAAKKVIGFALHQFGKIISEGAIPFFFKVPSKVGKFDKVEKNILNAMAAQMATKGEFFTQKAIYCSTGYSLFTSGSCLQS